MSPSHYDTKEFLTQMSCFSLIGKLEYKSIISGVLYIGVVFLVICRRQNLLKQKPEQTLTTFSKGNRKLSIVWTVHFEISDLSTVNEDTIN